MVQLASEAVAQTRAVKLIVLDRDGVIAWSYLSPIGVNPGAEGILKALDGLAGRAMADSARVSRTESPEIRA